MNIINLHSATLPHPFSEATAFSLAQAIEASSDTTFTVIAGTSSTAVQLWLDATANFPSLLCLMQLDDGKWCRFDWQCLLKEFDTRSGLESVIASFAQLSAEADKELSERITEVFKKFSYGTEERGEAEHFYERQLHWLSRQDFAATELVAQFELARKEGMQAAVLIYDLLDRLNRKRRLQSSERAVKVANWIENLTDKYPSRIVVQANKKLVDELDWLDKQERNRIERTSFVLSLPQLYSGTGVHPHNIRQLKPTKSWRIFIDETGKQFGMKAEKLAVDHEDLGRMVALLVPDYANLAPLSEAHHAADGSLNKLQTLLSSLIQQPVGVFGAKVNKDLLSGSWIGSIEQLIRWLLLMLPVDGPTNVQILIEQRDNYKPGKVNLSVLARIVESQLNALMPERFAKFNLHLDFMAKSHEYNGYVDAIANIWQSTDSIKHKMLQHIGWQENCLLEDTKMPLVEHLYRQVVQGEFPAPAIWLDAFISAGKESQHSLLQDMLDKLGNKIKSQPDAAVQQKLINQYLNQVHLRIKEQNIDLNDLTEVLQWLQALLPEERKLPNALELSLQSALLVASNHKGLFDAKQLLALQALADKYALENAPLVCHLMLRLASSCTNSFAFADASRLLSPWLKRSVETVGLLNRGKLLSTEGQLLAFQGQYDAALSYISEAVEVFKRLSDGQEKSRQIKQSWQYQIVMLLAKGDQQAIKEVSLLLSTNYSSAIHAIRIFAGSGEPQPYLHYLVLRAMVQFPEWHELRDTYMQEQARWQVGDSHPWMLIQAYRGWLLCNDNQLQLAQTYFSSAVNMCSEQQTSPILGWMGQCLAALASSLKLSVPELVLEQPLPQAFPIAKINVLKSAQNDNERLGALELLLPFNFH